MEEEGFERRRDSSSKAKEHRVAEHRALLPFLTFREQESLPHRVASSPKTLHHPLRTEILLTPLKVRFIFTRMEFNYISHLSFLFFSLSLFSFFIFLVQGKPAFNRLASITIPPPFSVKSFRNSSIYPLLVVFIFIRKYLNFTASSSGNYCLSCLRLSFLRSLSLSLPPSLPLFLCSSSFQRQSLPTREPPLLLPRNWNRYINTAGAANLRIPSNTVLFISRRIYSSASMSELHRKSLLPSFRTNRSPSRRKLPHDDQFLLRTILYLDFIFPLCFSFL